MQDFLIYTGWITSIADKHLSDFQKKSYPHLAGMLECVLKIKFLELNLPILAQNIGRTYLASKVAFVTIKKSQIQKAFLKDYDKASNIKFDFEAFNKYLTTPQQQKLSDFSEWSLNLQGVPPIELAENTYKAPKKCTEIPTIKQVCKSCLKPLPMSQYKQDKRFKKGYAQVCNPCNKTKN